MGRPSYAARVGAQPKRNVRSRHGINKISPALRSATCLGLMVTHAFRNPVAATSTPFLALPWLLER